MAEAAENQAPRGPGGNSRAGGAADAAEAPHGSPSVPLGRRARRTATAVLVALPSLLLGTGAVPVTGSTATAQAVSPAVKPATPAAQSVPSTRAAAPSVRAGTGSRSAEVSLNTVTPSVPAKGDVLTVSGTVTNQSRSVLRTPRLDLRVGPALGSRSAIQQATQRKGYLSGAEGNQVPAKYAEKLSGLAPGISRSFTLKVPVSALNLSSDGVYQLGVSLTGQTKAQPYPQILGIGRTVLPWQASDLSKKTGMTYLWPLISSTHLTARTESDEQQTPVFRDDALAKELAPGGRLQQMVALGDKLPITWVVDPDLIATVDMMARPKQYRVQKEGGGTVAGKGQAYAKEWLKDLQNAVRGKEVVALPFADPDLASLAHRAKNVPGALRSLSPATKRATVTVETVLHVKPSTDFAWPVNGAVDSSIVDVATSAGAHNVIARSDSIADASLSHTPTAARPIGSGNTALVADARLSTAFQGDMTDARASSLAVQSFLSQTLSIARQDPTRQRSLLVAPQRMPTVSQAQAMASAIKALDSSGTWTRSVPRLSDAAEAKPDAGATRRVPGPGSYPSSLRRTELPASAFEQVRRTQGTLDDFEVILSRADRVVPPFGNAIDREISNSWRGQPLLAKRFRDSVQSYLVGLKGKVRLIKKSDITLSGREATIPVTVQNNLVQDVDGLELRLESKRRIGLDVGDPKKITVAGGHSQSVKFDTTAKANGRATVTAQLYTKDGKPYGKEMKFRVTVTSITGTVLLVIAGGLLLMVLAGVRMYTQRKRSGPAPDPDAPLETPDSGETPDAAADGPDEDTDGGPEGGTGRDSDGGPARDSDDGTAGAPETEQSGDEEPADSGEADKGGNSAGPDESTGSARASNGVGGGDGGASDAGDTDRQNGKPPGAGEKVDR